MGHLKADRQVTIIVAAMMWHLLYADRGASFLIFECCPGIYSFPCFMPCCGGTLATFPCCVPCCRGGGLWCVSAWLAVRCWRWPRSAIGSRSNGTSRPPTKPKRPLVRIHDHWHHNRCGVVVVVAAAVVVDAAVVVGPQATCAAGAWRGTAPRPSSWRTRRAAAEEEEEEAAAASAASARIVGTLLVVVRRFALRRVLADCQPATARVTSDCFRRACSVRMRLAMKLWR